MHPGGRPFPHSPHVFEQFTQLAQRRCVRVVRKRALDPLHGPDGLVARQQEYARGGDEDYS
eukprot:2876643-Pleurochrysis_carterae.AAC.2